MSWSDEYNFEKNEDGSWKIPTTDWSDLSFVYSSSYNDYNREITEVGDTTRTYKYVNDTPAGKIRGIMLEELATHFDGKLPKSQSGNQFVLIVRFGDDVKNVWMKNHVVIDIVETIDTNCYSHCYLVDGEWYNTQKINYFLPYVEGTSEFKLATN